MKPVVVDLIDGTYELFRHFHCLRPKDLAQCVRGARVLQVDRRGNLFKRLATLRTDAGLFTDVESLRWRGPTDGFGAWTERMAAPQLLQRAIEVQAKVAQRK